MRRLTGWFRNHPKFALAFSGGCDSAFLLYAALQAHIAVRVFMVQSQFQHSFEREDALLLAKSLGAKVSILQCDILADCNVVTNGPERCYHCKKQLFACVQAAAHAEGYTCIVDGSNTSDNPAERPGMRALEEMQIYSPLRECGLAKADIRALSRAEGLPTWNRPANACLATRIPTGTAITLSDLRRVEHAEDYLRQLDFADVRVRLFHNAARIQVPQEQQQRAASMNTEIRAGLANDFETVLLDLESR